MVPARACVFMVFAALAGANTSCTELEFADRPPRVTVVASVTGTDCDANDTALLTIGRFVAHDGYETTESVVHEYANGDETTAITCSMVPKDDGYAVVADVQVVGPDSSRFVMKAQLVADAEPHPVTTSFNAHALYYLPRNCILTYATPQQTVAPGTVWAHVSCPNSPSADATKRINGKPVICDIDTTFRFEDCAR